MRKPSKVKKILDAYDSEKQAVYSNYAETVKFVVEQILSSNGFSAQIVTDRAKKLSSLKKKLTNPTSPTDSKKLIDKIKKLEDVKDLAGCRIIFYLEKNIEQFVQILDKEFEIVEYKPKFSEDGYNATHVIIKFKTERLKLSEYKKFAGLKCEIQLTTVLYHAWSEIEHDTIYKPDEELKKFDQRTFDSLKKSFADTMKDHIKQAQYNFDHIANQVAAAREGKKVFDQTFLKNITALSSHNEIYDNLKLLLKYIEEFGDKTPPGLNIIEIIETILKKTKKLKIVPMKTIVGDLPGHSYEDVSGVSLDIINRIKFIKPKEVFDLLTKVAKESDEKTQAKVLEVFGKFVEYNLNVLKKIGFQIQIFVLQSIEKWNESELLSNFNLVLLTINKLLNPSFEGSSWTDYKTLTMQSGALTADQAVIDTRNQAIMLGKRMYLLAENFEQRVKALAALGTASQVSAQGMPDEKMERVMIENINQLVDFYISILPTAENEVIKDIEEQSYWFIRRFTREKFPRINELEDSIQNNKNYQIYKVFVGYDGRYAPDMDYQKATDERGKRVDGYVDDLTEDSYQKWSGIIKHTLKNYIPNSVGEFHYLFIFFEKLGTKKPELAIKLLKENLNQFPSEFLISLCAGILKSKAKNTIKKLFLEWIRKSRHLDIIIKSLGHAHEIDLKIFKQVFVKAKNDVQILNSIIYALAWNYQSTKGFKLIFIDTLKQLTKNKNWWWISNFWVKCKPVIESFNKEENRLVLENLKFLPDINYEAEEVLSLIATSDPLSVTNFFFERIQLRLKMREDEKKDRYDAIPFDFTRLREELEKYPEIVIPEILKWFNKVKGRSRWLNQWESGQVLQNIFPSFSPKLEEYLIKLVQSGGKKEKDDVLSILDKYDGESFLFGTVKALITKYPDKDIRNRLFGILSKTGVVSGEDGLARAFEGKKQEIQVLKTDENASVQKFALEYEEHLEESIVRARKRSSSDIEMRKREFGGS